MTRRVVFILTSFATLCATSNATYSIVACDPQTRACGVAVQTNNLAVGASVPYAAAGVGALASQFETNPMYGPRGLTLLGAGKTPEQTLQQLLREDGNFDGEGTEARQVGIVSVDGQSFAYTGKEAAASGWSGSRTGSGYSIQGNGLAGAQVLQSMEQTYLATQGSLAERLMAALSAGDHAGGQSTGRESAALLVRTPAGFPIDVDLRVDHSSDPIANLRILLNIQVARQQVVQARVAADKGELQQAEALLIAGVSRAPMWPRIWIQGARVAAAIERPELAIQYLNIVFTSNPAWAENELGEGRYPQLGANPLFHRWITPAQKKAVLSEYGGIRSSKDTTFEKKIEIAKKLLEVGEPNEALDILRNLPAPASAQEELLRLKATTYAALGQYKEAAKVCSEAERRGSPACRSFR
jgi:uncharacterized Ntn-hydrolase superfamily protein